MSRDRENGFKPRFLVFAADRGFCMERKISLHFLLISFVSLILASAVVCVAYFGAMQKQVFSDLRLIAQAVEQCIDDDNHAFDSLDTRVTVVSPDGSVVYDNAADSDTMENHLRREEIEGALKNGAATASRESETVGKREYYYAKRLANGDVLRVSAQSDTVLATLYSSMPLAVTALLLVLGLCAFLATVLTKSIVKPIKNISEVIDSRDYDNYGYDELVPLVRKIKSQRTEIEKQLKKVREEKEKITTIMDNMSDGLILFDAQKSAVLINETAVKLLKTSENAIGERIYYITRNAEIIDCVKSADEGKSASAAFKAEGRIYQFAASPVFAKDRQNGVVCLVTDITEKAGLEKMRREFTANVSHELKTPLTSVMGYSELIENGLAKQEDVPKFAAKISKEAKRMLTLISDILKLSNLDEIGAEDSFEKVELKEVAEETAGGLALLAEKYGVKVNVSGGGAVVDGNRGRLCELVYNLCENAIRYNVPQGSVDIIVQDKELIVKDTGIGIPADKQSRVFERFYRVDKSRSKESGGTGLGLAIVKHIAAAHGASVSLESEEGKGTKITVSFK